MMKNDRKNKSRILKDLIIGVLKKNDSLTMASIIKKISPGLQQVSVRYGDIAGVMNRMRREGKGRPALITRNGEKMAYVYRLNTRRSVTVLMNFDERYTTLQINRIVKKLIGTIKDHIEIATSELDVREEQV